jgi:hypothetical protein
VRPDVERYSAMAHVSYDLSDRLNWFGEVAYSTSDALGTPANGGLGPTAMVVRADNAFSRRPFSGARRERGQLGAHFHAGRDQCAQHDR